jgi:hypothetical protein
MFETPKVTLGTSAFSVKALIHGRRFVTHDSGADDPLLTGFNRWKI